MTATKTPATKPTAEPVADVSMGEITDSITGYDEIAIEDNLKLTFIELAMKRNHMKWVRAHIAIYLFHKGEKAAVAWRTAMTMPQKELQTFFPSDGDPDDVTDESDAGKGEGAAVTPPARRPRSASSPE
jgi:hypothetical protein